MLGNFSPRKLLGTWVDTVQQWPGTTLALAFLTAALSAFYAATSLGFKTDRTDLVEPTSAHYQNWQSYCDEFGGESDIIVIVEGADRGRKIGAIETLARQIEAYPDHFEKLCHRIRIDKLRSKGLYQLSLDNLEEIGSQIESLRPLLIGAWSWMSVENVLRSTSFRLGNLPVERPMDAKSRQVLLSTARLLESLAIYLDTGRVYQSPWETLFAEYRGQQLAKVPDYFFSEDGRLAFLRVAPRRDRSSFTGLNRPVALVRELIARTQPVFPELTFGMTGVPVLEADEMQAAKRGSSWSMVLSVLGVSLLFVTAFRALRHPFFGVLTLMVSGCWTLGWVTLTVGHLNVLSVSFIVTLVGLGIDFAILWLSRFEASRSVGQSVPSANLDTAQSVGQGIMVGGVTTAMAFFATMATGFLGLREMGWIAGSGVLLCVFGAFTVLPALLAVASSPEIARERGRWDRAPVAAWVTPHASLVVAVFAVVVAGLATQIPRLSFDYNLLNLQAAGLPSVQWEKRLIEETKTSGWYAVSIADSVEEARRRRHAFESLGSVGRVVEMASLIPTDQEQKAKIIRAIGDRLQRLPATAPDLAEPKVGRLSHQLREVASHESPSHPRDRVAVRRLTAAADFANRTLANVAPTERAHRVGLFEKQWLSDLLEKLHQLKAVADPAPVTVADLPASLRARYCGRTGKWLLQIFAKESIWDIEPLSRFCADVLSVDAHATGKPISTCHALVQMNHGYRLSAVLAAAVVFALVWLDLRHPLDALAAMVPLLVGSVVMFGMMAVLGIALNPANMIALPLILGIGVDFGVHVLHDYRQQSGPYTLTWRLGRALCLTGLTTMIGFVSLLTAGHWGMVSIGLVMAIGVAACTAAVLLPLPAILYLCSRNREPIKQLSGSIATPSSKAA